MTATHARARLEDLRAQTLERLAALQGEHRAVVDASRDSNADDEHDPEGATIAFERAQVDALARDAVARLESVDDALARLDDRHLRDVRPVRRPDRRRPAGGTTDRDDVRGLRAR